MESGVQVELKAPESHRSHKYKETVWASPALQPGLMVSSGLASSCYMPVSVRSVKGPCPS